MITETRIIREEDQGVLKTYRVTLTESNRVELTDENKVEEVLKGNGVTDPTTVSDIISDMKGENLL